MRSDASPWVGGGKLWIVAVLKRTDSGATVRAAWPSKSASRNGLPAAPTQQKGCQERDDRQEREPSGQDACSDVISQVKRLASDDIRTGIAGTPLSKIV